MRNYLNPPMQPDRQSNLLQFAISHKKQKHAFTLIEVILALGLSVLVLAAVAMAVNLHLRLLDSGRTRIEEAQLAREILRTIAQDLHNAVPYNASHSSGSSSGSSSNSSESQTSNISPGPSPTPLVAAIGASLVGQRQTGASPSSGTSKGIGATSGATSGAGSGAASGMVQQPARAPTQALARPPARVLARQQARAPAQIIPPTPKIAPPISPTPRCNPFQAFTATPTKSRSTSPACPGSISTSASPARPTTALSTPTWQATCGTSRIMSSTTELPRPRHQTASILHPDSSAAK